MKKLLIFMVFVVHGAHAQNVCSPIEFAELKSYSDEDLMKI